MRTAPSRNGDGRKMRMVALLRGINVGSAKRLKMDALRGLFESLGLADAQTYLQSGNVIFESTEKNLGQLGKRIEAGIEETFGFHSDVILRTASQLDNVIQKNPFTARENIDPAKLLVLFLAFEPSAADASALRAIDTAPEQVFLSGSEVYIYYPNGMGRSKMPALDKILKTTGTGRNWNSVTNILTVMRTKRAAPALRPKQ